MTNGTGENTSSNGNGNGSGGSDFRPQIEEAAGGLRSKGATAKERKKLVKSLGGVEHKVRGETRGTQRNRTVTMTEAALEQRKKAGGDWFSDPDKRREAAKKGALVSGQRARERKAERERLIEEALRKKVDEQLDAIIAPYFEALALEPDPKWGNATKLAFLIDKVTVSEKLANRLEGLPVSRSRIVDEDGRDRVNLSGLPAQAVQEVIASAFASIGGDALDEFADVIDAEVVESEAVELPPGDGDPED